MDPRTQQVKVEREHLVMVVAKLYTFTSQPTGLDSPPDVVTCELKVLSYCVYDLMDPGSTMYYIARLPSFV